MAEGKCQKSSLIIVLICVFIGPSHGNRVFQKVYQDIQGDMACFKRFNGTHEIGCTSNFRGNVGVLHLVDSFADIDWVLDSGQHPPYILAFAPNILTEDVLRRCQSSGKVTGIALLNSEEFDPETELLHGFSSDQECPSRDFSFYSNSSDPDLSSYCEKKPWNPYGTSLLFTSWDFPIFLITNETSITRIKECYKKFNKAEEGGVADWPLCSVELSSNMYGTTNTEVCMRRHSLTKLRPINFCDPLHDYNIIGSILPLNHTLSIPEKSIIVVGARMDALSMFDNISPGANAAVSGLVTLLSTAEAIYRYKKDVEETGSTKNIIFILFQGESWDYIGSSRVVWDMLQGQFPFKHVSDEEDQMAQLNLTHIDYFIELNQVGLGLKGNKSQLYLHTDPISNQDQQIGNDTGNLIKELNIAANRTGDIVFKPTDAKAPLPPASMQSFLKVFNISGVVITDHKEAFENLYYESVFDNYENVKYKSSINETDDSDSLHQHISRLASTLATALFTLTTGRSKNIIADSTLVNDLLFCYLRNTNCTMFRNHMNPKHWGFLKAEPAKMYTSVQSDQNLRTYATKAILAHLMGEESNKTADTCKNDGISVYQYYYFKALNNGTCIQTTVRLTEAMSPAFLIENYDWQSGLYSTWSESGWQSTSARIFLKPALGGEIGLLCGGLSSIILSCLLVYFMNSRADLLFQVQTPPAVM